MQIKSLVHSILLLIVTIGIQACEPPYYFRSNYNRAIHLLHEQERTGQKPYLKAHLKNGDVCIFQDQWHTEFATNRISGQGKIYDFNRRPVYEGSVSLLIDSIFIFETNRLPEETESARVTALSILTALDIAGGVFCAINPKACFGSCPTFYINEQDNFHYADAEGFSNAISPSMEYGDIDALNPPQQVNGSFSITMKNEALETHCINELKLLAYPVSSKEKVYHSQTDEFYLCENNYSLLNASDGEGDITSLLKEDDRIERFSLSDPVSLCSKETLLLSFEPAANRFHAGLILNFRQTLMTTYLIYSAMGYMGDQVGDIFAGVEASRETQEMLEGGIKKQLGNIDVYVWNEQSKEWIFQDGFNETGPIAINRKFIPLKGISASGEVKVKLVLNKGLWRLDYAALTDIKSKVQPALINPESVRHKGRNNTSALSALLDPDRHLVSMPGSAYQIRFTLPDPEHHYQLFLYSKGYYLEWMRAHWIKDKDLLRLRQMIYHPEKFLRDEAKAYKDYESVMEEQFWNSKIETTPYSYYND